jgi:serine/threonine protein kinase
VPEDERTKEYGEVSGHRIVRPLGHGSFGDVLEARRDGGEKPITLKLIDHDLFPEPAQFNAFLAAAARSMRLSHANVVQVLDIGRDPQIEMTYLACEHVSGVTLSTLLEYFPRSGLPAPEGLCVLVASEIAKALDHAHHRADGDGRPLGIVHADLVPNNVFLTWDGEVKVADFCIGEGLFARDLDTPLLLRKWAHSSPERARGELIVPVSDLFATGILLFELLTGENPFERPGIEQTRRALGTLGHAPSVKELRPDTDDRLAAITESLLMPDPAQRLQSAARLHEALLAYSYQSQIRFGPGELLQLLSRAAEQRMPAPPSLRGLLESVGEGSAPEIELRYESLEVQESVPPPWTGEASLHDTTLLLFASVEPASHDQLVSMDATLRRHGARILELGTHETRAIFGLEQTDGRDAETAARCALTLLRFHQRDNLGLSCGMATARLRVTAEDTPLEGAALTAAISAARSLSGRRGWLVVDRRSARQLRRGFELEPLGSGGENWAVEEQRREPLGEFVGRRGLLRELGVTLKRAHGGRLHVVGLVGQAGVGKTRFLSELVRRLQDDGESVGYAIATCTPDGHEQPLSGADAMLRALCDVREGDSRVAVASVEPELRSLGLTDHAVSSVLARIGSNAPMPEEVASLGPVLTQMFASRARERLQLFAWDDAQELDRQSCDLLARSIAALAGARVVFLFAARPEEQALYRELPGYTEIKLPELDKREARRLVEQRLGVDRVPDHVFDHFYERAGGQPMFLEELVHEALESKALVVGHRFVESAQLGAMDVPRTLRSALSGRVRRLPDEHRNILAAAAILGTPVDLAVLAQLCELSLGRASELAVELEERELIRRRENLTLGFFSPLLPEVVLAGMDEGLRAHLNHRAADAYQAVFGGESDEVAPRIAEHLRKAGEGRRAARYFAKSGLTNLRAGRMDKAALELGRALASCELEQVEPGDLVLQVSALVQAVAGSRDRTVAVQAAERLASTLTPASRVDARTRVQVLLDVARILAGSDREGTAHLLLVQLVEAAEAWPDLYRAALMARAEMAPRGGDFAEAIELLAKVRALGAATPREEHRLLLTQAQALAGVDRYDEALARVEEAAALEIAEEAFLACERARTRAVIAAFKKDWGAAAEASEEAAEKAKSAGLTREVAANLHNQGEALVRLGELARGYAVLHASLALAEESGSERIANHDRLLLAYLDAVDGLPGADEMLASSIANAEARGWVLDHLTGRFLLGRLHAQRGEMDTARRELHAVQKRAQELGNRPLARDCGYELELLEPTLADSPVTRR